MMKFRNDEDVSNIEVACQSGIEDPIKKPQVFNGVGLISSDRGNKAAKKVFILTRDQ